MSKTMQQLSFWICKSGQVWELKGPKDKSTTTVLINECKIKLPSKFVSSLSVD